MGMGKPRKYNTEEERKQAKIERDKRYYQANKDKIAERHAEYYQANKDKIAEYRKANKDKFLEKQSEYYKTPFGRASKLISTYIISDRKYNRIGDELPDNYITVQWVIDNIFSKSCRYCGESDWLKIGCDRIDNSLPHTIDNVVPCCYGCNRKRGTKEYKEFIHETQNSPIHIGV